MLDILLEISRNQTFLNLLGFQLPIIDPHGYLTHVRYPDRATFSSKFIRNNFRYEIDRCQEDCARTTRVLREKIIKSRI